MTRQLLAKIVVGAVALATTIWVFIATLESAPSFQWPSPLTAAAACLAIACGLAGASFSWAALFEGSLSRRRAVAAFLLAQPAKYLPVGGVAQAAGQIGLSESGDQGRMRVTGLFLIHAGIQVSAGLTVGGLSAFFAPTLSNALRGFLAALLLAPLLLSRPLMVVAVDLGSRILRKPSPGDSIPSQAALLVSGAWAFAPILASGFALSLLMPVPVGTIGGIVAFGAAWSLGFLAIPFPSGLGVREGVLVALLGVNPAVVIAGSAAHRLATILVEGVGVLVAIRLRS